MMSNGPLPPDKQARIWETSTAVATPPLNRHGRRKQQAIARKERHLFNRYKAHMAQKGYDATFDDFIKDMP